MCRAQPRAGWERGHEQEPLALALVLSAGGLPMACVTCMGSPLRFTSHQGPDVWANAQSWQVTSPLGVVCTAQTRVVVEKLTFALQNCRCC